MKADLHLHTSHSDGNWSPSDMVAHARAIGMDVIAVTDHDTVTGIDEAIESAAGRVEVIPAVEINTVWLDSEGLPHDVHILGYFIERGNEALLALLERQLAARLEQVEKLVGILQDEGILIAMDLVREIAGGSPIGKVHVTQAIVEVGGARDVTEAYHTFYDKRSRYFVRRESVTPFDAIEAIHKAGGITSIAHPGHSGDLSELVNVLAKHGLDAVEAYHTSHDSGYVERQVNLARELGLLITGGSDCHGPFEEHASLMGTIDVPPDVVPALKRAIASRF